MLLARADGLVVRDRAAMLLTGSAATPQLVQNLSVAVFLYHCGRLRALEEEYSSDVYAILRSSVVVSVRCSSPDPPDNLQPRMQQRPISAS